MKVVFIGAGNLATNLCLALKNAGFDIKQIYSRTSESAELLATKTNCLHTNNINEINKLADLYITALPDEELENVLQKLSFIPTLLVHTSGSLPMDILKKYCSNYGVLYPLQTFSKNKILDFKNIPVCVEGNNKKTETKLLYISKKISNNVSCFNSEQRSKIHLAAVFACNFTNHIYAVSYKLLQKEKISFELLKPLIEETFIKAMNTSPVEIQTGPAVRNDKKILAKHKEMLKDNPLLQKIYSFVSESIYKNRLK